MAVTIKHEDLTNAAPNPSALVDGPKWDKAHTVVQTGAGVLGATGAGTVDVLTASAARTLLDVDQAGTDNSTDVTVSGAYDYITLDDQELTLNQIDLETDVTGTLPAANGGLDGAVDETATVNGQSLFWDTSTDPDQWTKAYRSPRDPTASLLDFLPSGYVVHTTTGTGTDVGPYIKNALDSIRARYGRGKLLIPPQRYRVETAIPAASLNGCDVEGWGTQASHLVWDNNSGDLFRFDAAGGYTGGSIRKMTLFLENGYPSSTATAIKLQGDATYQPSRVHIEEIDITVIGNSYWYNGFFVYARDRSSPQGVRVNTIKNLQVFSCTNTGVYLDNVVQWTGENIGIYTGSGGGLDMRITGGGSTLTNSTHCFMRGLNIGGNLILANCDNVEVRGKCGGLQISSADFCEGWINNSGSTTGAFGSNSNVTIR